MYTSPSPDFLLEGVITALQNDIMPAVGSPKAQATVAMMQAVLQQVRQTIPVYAASLVADHNGANDALARAAEALGDAAGAEAERIRTRAAEASARPSFEAPLQLAALMTAQHTATQDIVETMRDLDVLQRAGDARADAALEALRDYLAIRYIRDRDTLLVGAGMVGRG